MKADPPQRQWTFLSNHAHVLVCLARDPCARLRDVAADVGITERAVQKIVGDLEEAGVLQRERAGRRNTYRLELDLPLRHALEAHRTVGSLLAMILDRSALKRLTSV
jgi:DNA-binding MarR family transcriptional regulator